ncbi:MAG: sulfite exporter TauE/SafE family protein [Actinobacteria bacterium]|nr:sulfite exporter TauE/SafE family protein [Actinomycetota bacterium]
MPAELLAIPFGIAVGILLGLLGGGGSILAVPVLVYVLGQEVRAATTESLIIVGVTAAIAAGAHHRAGHVRWRPAFVFSSAAAIGAFAGTALNRLVDPEALLASFALLLLLAAAGVVRRRGETPGFRCQGGCLVKRALPVGFTTGALTGFYGVGGGFLIVPTLAVLLGVGFAEAIGTSLAVIALTSAAALVAHLASGSIDWPVTASFTAAAVIGALVGTRASDRVPTRQLQFGFAALLVGVAAFLLAKNANGIL